MVKRQMDKWKTQSVPNDAAKLADERAELIRQRDKRLRQRSEHEAIHKAVAEMI